MSKGKHSGYRSDGPQDKQGLPRATSLPTSHQVVKRRLFGMATVGVTSDFDLTDLNKKTVAIDGELICQTGVDAVF
ncbi:MAG: hypothetical protein OEL91_09720 [Burkholderiaceae bacterium]|nr:hypothetical protein [Burkholderiaceae bacterium]